ncbi:MAG: NAD-binding protein [Halolamina sp.]
MISKTLYPTPREQRTSADGGDPTHVVVGADSISTAVAEQLRTSAYDAAVVEVSDEGERLDSASTTDALSGTPLPAAETVVVATRSDARNMLLGQAIRTKYPVSRVVVLVNDPDCAESFDDAGFETVCATTTLTEELVEAV